MTYNIKQVEHICGVKAHTLRIWECRYSFMNTKRTKTNIRYYTDNEVKKILKINHLLECGYKLKQITKMDNEKINYTSNKMSKISNEIENSYLIKQLIMDTLDSNVDSFRKVLSDIIQQKGIERIFSQIFIYYLQKIGILWINDKVRVSNEHLFTNIMRNKLIVEIEKELSKNNIDHNYKVIHFLPEKEFHDISLLYSSYLSIKENIDSIYLGSNTPTNDMLEYSKELGVNTFFSHISNWSCLKKLEQMIPKMEEVLNEKVTFIISGSKVDEMKLNESSYKKIHVVRCNSISKLKLQICRLMMVK